MQECRRRTSPGTSRVVKGQGLGKEQNGCPLTSHFSFHSWKSRREFISTGFCIHWITLNYIRFESYVENSKDHICFCEQIFQSLQSPLVTANVVLSAFYITLVPQDMLHF